jgi:pyridinium-3,5-bisthiocarboxylic acid mononucleotide nickel chelatase
MSKILYFDCFAGASGDMVLGALIDAGLPLHELEAALGSLMIPGYRLTADRVLRSGLSATKFRVSEDAAGSGEPAGHHHHHGQSAQDQRSEQDSSPAHHHHHGQSAQDQRSEEGFSPAHHHHHGQAAEDQRSEQDSNPAHHHHHHRTLAEINALIDGSALRPAAKSRAVDLFRRLAEAEAEIHQMPVERVHLHEVGELDSIIDIVGAAFAMEWMGADRVIASPLNVGGGMVRSAHGVFPVPAPATLKLLGGAPVYSSGVQMETVTPTGALLVTGYAAAFGPLPAMRVERVGYGAGDRDLPGTPNVLRVVVGREDEGGAAERVVVLECEIDDMNPQIFGVLMDKLYAAGALEVFYAAVQMKKNRPGTLLTVVGPPDHRDRLAAIVFRETTTIGLRYQELSRACLERESVLVETGVGPVRFKVARQGSEVMNASPEFEDCARLAADRGLPVKEVQALAVRAYWESRRA